MITLEQVRLLETKITKAIDYLKHITAENAHMRGDVVRLNDEKAQLGEKLDSYERRIGELEVMIQEFKEEHGRIEEGILSALGRLNQFEDAIEQQRQQQYPGAPVPPPVYGQDAPRYAGAPDGTAGAPRDGTQEGAPREAPLGQGGQTGGSTGSAPAGGPGAAAEGAAPGSGAPGEGAQEGGAPGEGAQEGKELDIF